MATNDDRAVDSEEESDSPDRIGTEPIDGEGVYPFAGLTRFDDDVDAMTLPEGVWDDTSSMQYWAQNKTQHSFDGDNVDRDLDPSVLPERGLSTMIPDLPRATEAEVQWVHPRTGETLGTAKHNAVINPQMAEEITWGIGNLAEAIASVSEHSEETAQEMLDEHGKDSAMQELLNPNQRSDVEEMTVGDDALFNIPTDDYTIINPDAFLRPLTETIQDREWGDKVFGEVRLDRGGGRANLDVYLDGQHVESPVFAEDRDPVVVGLNVQWDFFGDWAVRACGQALDWSCDNHISRLTDREIVKHTGDVESRQDWYNWFDQMLDRLEEKRDQLSRIIQAAAEDTLDFSDLPNDIAEQFEDADAAPWTALYNYMGLPGYLAEEAGRRLRSQADDAYQPNWWEIHSAATYSVTHSSRAQRGSGTAYDQYAQTANDMLFNPPAMENRIIENYQADRHDDGQDTLDVEGGGVADIQTAFENTREKKEKYEEWEADLKDMGIEV